MLLLLAYKGIPVNADFVSSTRHPKTDSIRMTVILLGVFDFDPAAGTVHASTQRPSASCMCHADSLALSLEVVQGIKRKGHRLPTPIQREKMPLILQGQDVVGIAQTG